MILFVPGFLENTPGVGQDYRVCGDDKRRIRNGGERVVYGDTVHVKAFLDSGLEHVFKRGEIFGEVLGFG